MFMLPALLHLLFIDVLSCDLYFHQRLHKFSILWRCITARSSFSVVMPIAYHSGVLVQATDFRTRYCGPTETVSVSAHLLTSTPINPTRGSIRSSRSSTRHSSPPGLPASTTTNDVRHTLTVPFSDISTPIHTHSGRQICRPFRYD